MTSVELSISAIITNICVPCYTQEYGERGWSPVIISSVGQFLYKLILHDVKIDPSITKLAKLTESVQRPGGVTVALLFTAPF